MVNFYSSKYTIPQRTLPLYQEGKLVGEARRVNFYDNAKVKRRGRPTGSSRKDKLEELPKDIPSHKVPSSSISFAEIAKKSKEAGES